MRSDYQRAVFAPPYNDELRFKHEADQGNVAGIRDFIAGELPYYVRLFTRVRHLADPYHFDEAFPHVGYNGLTDIDLQSALDPGGVRARTIRRRTARSARSREAWTATTASSSSTGPTTATGSPTRSTRSGRS